MSVYDTFTGMPFHCDWGNWYVHPLGPGLLEDTLMISRAALDLPFSITNYNREVEQ